MIKRTDSELLELLLEKVVSIDTKVNSIESRMGSLESKMDSLDSRMDSLDSRVGSLESKMNSLDSRVGSIESKINSLDSMVTTLQSDVQIIKTDVKVLQLGQKRIENKLDDLEAKNANRHIEITTELKHLESAISKMEIVTAENWSELARIKYRIAKKKQIKNQNKQ